MTAFNFVDHRSPLFTSLTIKHSAEELIATFFRQDPRAILPGWIVANVTSMSALQIGNPVILFILVKSNNNP